MGIPVMLDFTNNEDILSLPIDQYSRQKWAATFIEQIRKKNNLKILDVGGYKGVTHRFHQNDKVIVCDLYDIKEKNYVKGDGRDLPFKKNEFDFVVTFDTYEHVPRGHRHKFITELDRVATEGVLLAAPFDDKGGGVLQAEEDLNEYHRILYNTDHRWLKEHIDYRVPYKEELDKLLEKLGRNYVSMGSNDLLIWVLIQTIYFSIPLDEDLRGRVDDINRYYNNNLLKLDPSERQTYRQIYFISNDKEYVKQIRQFINKQKKYVTEETKAHFFAFALSVWGQKYRDIEQYKNYLEDEIQNLKQKIT